MLYPVANFPEISLWLYVNLNSQSIALSFLLAFFLVRHQDEFKLLSLPNGLSDVFATFAFPFPVESDGNSFGAFESETFVLLIELGFISISNSSTFSGMRAPRQRPDYQTSLMEISSGQCFGPISTSTCHCKILFRDSRERCKRNLRSFTFIPLCTLDVAAEKPHTLHLRW